MANKTKIVTTVNRLGPADYHFEIKVMCPFCDTHYVNETERRPIPCKYCEGRASKAKVLEDQMVDYLKQSEFRPLDEMIRLHENLSQRPGSPFSHELRRRIKARTEKLMEQKK